MTEHKHLANPSPQRKNQKTASGGISSTSRGLSGQMKGSSSAGMIDVELFGGVVTNIEKLLTPRQKQKINRKMRHKAMNKRSLTVYRDSVTRRAAPHFKTSKGRDSWHVGQTNTRSHTEVRGIPLQQTCFNPKPLDYHFAYEPVTNKNDSSMMLTKHKERPKSLILDLDKVESKVGNFVRRETCSPFKAFQQHLT